MSAVHYKVVEHDGGWAYTALGVFSETFRTRDQALAAARRAAGEQRVGGDSMLIQYQDDSGRWVSETADGHDRPVTDVQA